MTANRLDQLIDAWDPILRRAFLEAVNNMRSQADVQQIVRMLESRDVAGALAAVGLDPVAFRPFDKAITDAFEAGGNFTAKALPVIRDAAGFKTVFQFAIRNPAAEAWLRDHSSTLVREVLDDQRDMIRGFLTEGLARGANPRTSALDLVGRIGASGRREGGSLGLTSSQEGWVRAYADELASNKPGAALERALRDRRFDAAVRRAAEKGEAVPAELRAKMVASYRNRSLRYRAETIARSETLRSLHQAQDESMRQAVAGGAVQQDNVTGVWRVAKPRGKNARESHTPMDGQVARFGRPFTTGSGIKIMFPGDPNAPISETASCRCFREMRVDFLQGVR